MTRSEKRAKLRRMDRQARQRHSKRGGLEPLIPKGNGLVPEYMRLNMLARTHCTLREIPHDRCFGPDCTIRHSTPGCAGTLADDRRTTLVVHEDMPLGPFTKAVNAEMLRLA